MNGQDTIELQRYLHKHIRTHIYSKYVYMQLLIYEKQDCYEPLRTFCDLENYLPPGRPRQEQKAMAWLVGHGKGFSPHLPLSWPPL